MRTFARLGLVLAWAGAGVGLGVAQRADWPEWGGSPGRNNVSAAKGLPAEWDVGRFDYRSGE